VAIATVREVTEAIAMHLAAPVEVHE